MSQAEKADVAIRAQGLVKQFQSHGGAFRALNGVSFDVARDKVFCILGPNGAGKTTLLRTLTTLMRPTEGTAFVEGFEIGRQNIEIRSLIGVVAQDNHFDKYLTLWQNLTLHARMQGMEKPAYEKRISELLEKVDLYKRRDDFLEEFSGGMQRRAALIRALIHEPKILFLDEPTTGLDPGARIEIWETIQKLKQHTTVILTTHYMEEADRLSDRIMILNRGEIVMTGTPDELKRKMSPPATWELHFNRLCAEEFKDKLSRYMHDVHVQDKNALCFKLNAPDDLFKIVEAVGPHDLQSIGLAQADLETVYLTVARQNGKAEARS